MHILVINVHSAANAGDAVLNQVTVAQLQASFPQATITFAMNDPDSHRDPWPAVGSFVYWMKEGTRWRWGQGLKLLAASLVTAVAQRRRQSLPFRRAPWFPLLQAYAQADLVVSCAGNFLYSSGKVGLPLLIAVYTIAYAWLMGKPLYMMPQTIGPLRRGWERRVVGWALRKMRMVFVRDAVSWQALQRLSLQNTRCYQVPDVAFAFPKGTPAAGAALLQQNGLDPANLPRPLLGVTVIDWGAQTGTFGGQGGYETAVAAAIRHFLQTNGGHAVLFAQVQGPTPADDDRIPAGRIYQQLFDLHSQITYITQEVSPVELKAAYGFMDFFLGTRLHANIFSLSEGVPVVAIQYQYKTRGIMRLLGMEQWVINIESVMPQNLSQLLQRAWLARAEMKQHIQQTLPAITEEAGRVAARIAQDFYA
ncbi:MAG: polysaccharide pyruvyl transferase family protein [Ardenticatenaceae bacterium]|nr:polysaccharide pyruvyl transferase family protein [Ardenticatenaceae bacterium]MCB8991194.1 polysaccharide pyruvyl transferase family protein [Ardenticatenaceae bacterium]